MLEAKMDWLAFTIRGVASNEVISQCLQLDFGDFVAVNKGLIGYNSQLCWNDGNIKVLYNQDKNERGVFEHPNNAMGVHVIMTGDGCEQYSLLADWSELFTRIKALDYHITRLDLAIDDLNNTLIEFDKLHQYAVAGCYTSRWSIWKEIFTYKTKNNEAIGRTLYFGSPKSDLQCRIYDKALESGLAEENWTRIELTYKNDHASNVFNFLHDGKGIGEVVRSTLSKYLTFRTPNFQDKNKSRWPVVSWWAQFIKEAESLQMTTGKLKSQKSIEQMQEWLEKQISPTLAAVMLANKGDMTWFYTLLDKGKMKFKKKHLDAIKNFVASIEESENQ